MAKTHSYAGFGIAEKRRESTMDYVRLGTTGLKVSRLCLGCMTYGSPQGRPWVLDEAGVTAPIIGVSKPHHIADAVAALEVILPPEEIAALEAPDQVKPVLDHA